MKKILLFSALLWIGIILMPDLSYAQISESASEEIYDWANQFIAIMWRAWIVPATIAGKLLSNEFVFWEFIGLNTYLFMIWQIMRNFANFFIGALFLWFIFKSLYDGALSDSIKRIGKLLIAAILVNMSRFFMAVLVDLSIVATTAVSSLPVRVLEKTRDQKKYDLKVHEVYTVRELWLDCVDECDPTKTKTVSLDSITPHADNMSWPIVFMWVWLLWLLRAEQINDDIKKWESLSLTALIKLVTLIMFIIPVLLLLIINVIRIFWIWVWIVFSPFLVLDAVLWEDMPGKWAIEEKLKVWDRLWHMFGLIFQPVVVVGTMAVWLILVTSLVNIINGNGDTRGSTLEQLQVDGNPPTLDTWLASTTIKGSVFREAGNRTLGFFGEMILSIFVIMILWGMIKIGFSTSAVTKDLTTKLTWFASGMAKSIPMVPIFWWQSINSLTNNAWENIKKMTWLKTLDINQRAQVEENMKKFGKFMGRWDEVKFWSNTIASLLSNAGGNKWAEYWNQVKDAMQKEWVTSLKYDGHLKEIATKRFSGRTVGWLRNDLNNKRLFDGIKTPQGKNVEEMKIADLETVNNWTNLANFITSLLEGKTNDINALQLASNNSAWGNLTQRTFL